MTSDIQFHPSHEAHPLEKTNHRGRYKCDGCKMYGTGLSYRCEGCDFDLHQECLTAASIIQFKGRTCIFLEKPIHDGSVMSSDKSGRSCDACGMPVNGFVYHCDETGFDFHPRCTKLLSEICIDDVVFRLEEEGSSKCQYCNRKFLKGRSKKAKIQGWSYVSNHNDYNFHVYCLMDMVLQRSDSTTNSNSDHITSQHGGDNMSLAALEGLDLTLQTKSKKTSGNKKKWLGILEVFLKTVLSILIGDPTAILASVLAHLVTEAFGG